MYSTKILKENRKKRSSKDEKTKEEKREYDIEWTEKLFDYKKGMPINPDEYSKNLYYKNN